MTLAKQAEAYKNGTPAFRKAVLLMMIGIFVVVIGTILVLVLVFHKTAHGGGPGIY